MKKVAISLACVLLVLAMSIGMIACGNNSKPADTTGASADQTTGAPDETTGASDETTEPTEETNPTTPRPTFPELTDDNSLNLTNMKVVLPASPTDVETNAAKELVDYVEKMTGKVISVVNEGAAVEAGIYVGNTEFAKTNNVTCPTTEYGEGWAIKAVDGNLVLYGEAVRGTLYAVYHLLEDALGIHWLTYDVEVVPEAEAALVWDAYDDSGAPAFKYRDMYTGGYVNLQNMFTLRNRLNGKHSNYPVEGYGDMENYGSPAYVHTFAYYVPSIMFTEHPEWFSLIDGERVPDGQLCMTNEDLKEYMTNKLLDYIADDIASAETFGRIPRRWYAIVPSDKDMFCECENCVAAIEKSGLSGYLLQLVNYMADAAAEKYPEVLIDTLAYWQYIEPPLDDTKPADNVVVRFCWNECDIFHSISHSNNAKMLEWLQTWRDLTKEGQLFFWDYLVTYNDWGIQTFTYKMPDQLQTILENGVVGYFGEIERCIATDFWDLKVWVITKLLEDPYQDFEYLLDTFINNYYGEAAPYVREYLDFAEGVVANDTVFIFMGTPTNALRCFTVEDIITADEIFKKAFEAAGDNEELLVRLRLARFGLDRLIFTRFNYFERTAKDEGVEFNISQIEVCERALACMEEQTALRGRYDDTFTADSYTYGLYKDTLEKLKAKQ